MILQNQKTGATINTGKISLRTLADRLLAKGYTSDTNMYELSNTRAHSKSGDSWHSDVVHVSEDGRILVKKHFLNEIDSKGNQGAILLATAVYEEKALTRFSVEDIIVQLNMGVIEDLGLTEDRYLENIKDRFYNSTGISKYDVPRVAVNQTPQVAQPMYPQANPALPYIDPVTGYFIHPAPQLMTQPIAQQVMAAQMPGFPINQPIQTTTGATTKTTIENQPETISVNGIQLPLDPLRDMCQHKNLATGESLVVRHTRLTDGNRFVDDNMYAYCPQCGQTWMEKPVTPETVKDAWHTVKSAIEYIKVNKQLSHQELKDLIAIDLGVFGLQNDIAKIQRRCWPETSFATSPAAQNDAEPNKGDSGSSK